MALYLEFIRETEGKHAEIYENVVVCYFYVNKVKFAKKPYIQKKFSLNESLFLKENTKDRISAGTNMFQVLKRVRKRVYSPYRKSKH